DALNTGGDHVDALNSSTALETTGIGEGAIVPIPALDSGDDIDIPPSLRRITLTEDECRALEEIDLDVLAVNERTLVLKLRRSHAAATELDRRYLAKILARAGRVAA